MPNKLDIISVEDIKNNIYIIRGKQVMLDSDVANLYEYKTKSLNLAVKRNLERFPEEFCFQLTEKEFENLRFQFETLNKKANNGKVTRKYLPYVFTEQGITMLAGVLKSEIAVRMSIKIIKAFVEMRNLLVNNDNVFERLTTLEYKQIENEKNFNEVFNRLQSKEKIEQKVFFEGQIYDAYSLIIKLIEKADKKIEIIDNYIDESILEMLTKKKRNVEVVILTANMGNIKNIYVQKFNKQYPTLKIATTKKFHDRFIILDNKELYHCGASIKDLGKRCFAISKIENNEVINIIKNIKWQE